MQMSPVLRKLIERGRGLAAVDYAAAVAGIPALNEALDPVFDEFDAIVTPAAPGEAPRGLESTGNPIFCTLWTYLGTPAVTLPLLRSAAGMPLGVQLVGRRHGDARLLRTARWLAMTVGRASRGPPTEGDGRPTGRVASRGKEEIGAMTLITGIIGLAMLVAFLGILLWWIKALPLTVIVVAVLVLQIWDFVQALRSDDNRSGR